MSLLYTDISRPMGVTRLKVLLFRILDLYYLNENPVEFLFE